MECECEKHGFCPRRNRRVTPLGHKICREGNEERTRRYFATAPVLEEDGAPSPPPEAGSIVTRVARFGKAAVRHVRAGMPQAPPEVIEERRAICAACPHLVVATNSCAKCGCGLKMKTAWALEKCPIDKWPAYTPIAGAAPKADDAPAEPPPPPPAPPAPPEAVLTHNGTTVGQNGAGSPQWNRRPSPTRSIRIGVPLSSWTGYGQMGETLGREFERMGIVVTYNSGRPDERYTPLSDFVRRRVAPKATDSQVGWWLNVGVPTGMVSKDRHAAGVAFTMWETTRLSDLGVKKLNGAHGIVVPCRHNEVYFQESGVRRPIAVVPLGIDPEVYFDDGEWVCDHERFTFGGAGRMSHGGVRKNLEFLANCFVKAVPRMPRARLILKVWPDCHITLPRHEAIRLDRRPLTPTQIVAWYRALDCYVTPARGEGWGLQTHQAMAIGRPVIAVPWSGTADFWEESCGWPVEYDIMPAVGFYNGRGHWAVAREESMIEALVHAYESRDECRQKGRAAAARAAEFPWSRTARELVDVLQTWGVLVPERAETK